MPLWLWGDAKPLCGTQERPTTISRIISRKPNQVTMSTFSPSAPNGASSRRRDKGSDDEERDLPDMRNDTATLRDQRRGRKFLLCQTRQHQGCDLPRITSAGDEGIRKVIVYKNWIQQDKSRYSIREWQMEGWFLFGFIPLFVRDLQPRGRFGKKH